MAEEKKVVAKEASTKKDAVKTAEATKATKAKKASATKTSVAKEKVVEKTKDEKDKDLTIQNLQKQIEEQNERFNKLMEQLALNNASKQPIVIKQPKEKKYRVINLTDDHNVMTIKTNSNKYDMKGYGTSRLFNEEDFKDVYSLQRKLFFYGALTTDTDGLKYLEEIGYIDEGDVGKKITGVYLTRRDLDTLDELSADELESLFKKVHPLQQMRIVDAFLEGFEISDKKGFKDLEKIMVLNRLYVRDNKYKERLKNAILKISENK